MKEIIDILIIIVTYSLLIIKYLCVVQDDRHTIQSSFLTGLIIGSGAAVKFGRGELGA